MYYTVFYVYIPITGGQGIERKKELFVRNIFRGTFKGGYGNLNRKNNILKIEILINLEIF